MNAINIAQLEQSVNELNQRCLVGEGKINDLQNQMAANESTIKANRQQLAKLTASLGDKYTSLEQLENDLTQI
ncbi:hypothetical protein OFC58_40000, partial [Escherichia coli]|nr:hypothetical protein [Escherichia coli]